MTPERDFHYTLIKYLDIKGKQELSNIIKRSRIVYDMTSSGRFLVLLVISER